MNESNFINSIDAKFPYHDDSQVLDLIIQGSKISVNSSFMVLHEICRIPRSIKVQMTRTLQLVDLWASKTEHPLKDIVLEAALAIINNQGLPVARSVQIMLEITKFKGQYCALSIPYFACDDINNIANDQYQLIIDKWQNE